MGLCASPFTVVGSENHNIYMACFDLLVPFVKVSNKVRWLMDLAQVAYTLKI